MDPAFADGLHDGSQTTDRPTHRLEDIMVGDSGVQLLISTKDHLYDAKSVHAGNDSWQVIGAWDESSIQELGKMLSSREPRLKRQGVAGAGAQGSTSFKSTYGTGHKLGAPDEGPR
ncbi:hypothetical protein BGZ63DRAFT_425590 [Mariannaea sp. PMI_226]|nr:hypothetical protein BGZ63DRAFT_425590 [Mariannaea sp. PMI_226]